ncbi:hypothetical protein ACF0H5_014907 [Mactra antiquata]
MHLNFIIVFTFLQIISGFNGEKVSCNVGFNFITEKVPVKFSVTEQPVYYGCFPDDFESGDSSWPGEPTNLKYTFTSKQDFILSWKPPDDSSAQHVTGFLLKLYVEDFSYINSMDPDVCYFINFSKSQLQATPQEGSVIQDAVIRMQCHVTHQSKMSVRLFLTTLPLPSPPRPFQEIQQVIRLNGTNEEKITVDMTSLPVTIVTHPIKTSSYYQQATSVDTVILSTIVILLSVFIIIITIYGGYRCMKKQTSQHHSNWPHSEDSPSRDYVRNNERISEKYFTEEEYSRSILQKDLQDDYYNVTKYMVSEHVVESDNHVNKYCDNVTKCDNHVDKYCDHVTKCDNHAGEYDDHVTICDNQADKYCDYVTKDNNHFTKYADYETKNFEIPKNNEFVHSAHDYHTNNNGGLPEIYRDIFLKMNMES